MNKAEAYNYGKLVTECEKYGLTIDEVDNLLRIEKTLKRWAERECGDGGDWVIERDETTDKPYNVYHGQGESRRYAIADRENGALKRAQAIAAAHGLTSYHQGDCRGCMLYLLRPGDIPDGESAGSCYNRGIAMSV